MILETVARGDGTAETLNRQGEKGKGLLRRGV